MLLIRKPAARLFAQIIPDLRDKAPECVARHNLGAAWARQSDVDNAFHLAGTIGHDHNTIRELYGLGDIVSNQQRRLLEFLLDLQDLVAEQKPGLLVKRGKR